METKQSVRRDTSAEKQKVEYNACSIQSSWVEPEDESDWSPFLFHYPDTMQIKKSKSEDLTSEEREKIIQVMFKYQHPVYKRLAEI